MYLYVFYNNCFFRTATIVCKEDTHLAILTKASFKEILTQHYQNLDHKNFEFFQKIPLFKNWKIEYIEQFSFQLQLFVYPKNHVLFDENKESMDIYFIKQGEIEVFFKKIEEQS
jgi:CRP-like cAMP-binding protein